MSTVYDWSQAMNPIMGLINAYSQKQQYGNQLDKMFGSPEFNPVNVSQSPVSQGPQAQGPLGITPPPQNNMPIMSHGMFNPVGVTPSPVTAPPPPNVNVTPNAPDNTPIQSYSGPMGQALGFDQSSALLPMLSGMDPAAGMQMMPQLLLKSMERKQQIADKTMRTLTPQEALAKGYRPGSVVQEDPFGNDNTAQASDLKSPEAIAQTQDEQKFTNQLPATPYQTASLAHENATLGETRRHDQATEYNAQHPANPFGAGTYSTATGDAFLQSLSPGIAAQIKAVANYRQAPPANRASKEGIAFMSLVNQYDPSYDATQYGSKVKARNDFATGKNGNTVRSLNVSISHLDTLGQLSDALGNGNLQLANQLGQAVSQQTGNPAPTNFDAAKQIVGDEIVKAVVGTGGSQQDRDKAATSISRASSLQQLKGVIQTYQQLLAGQLGGLKQQYTKSTGLNDFEDYLSPETRSKLQGHAASPPSATSGWSNFRAAGQ